jgi:FkbM family methyltransferase
MKVLLPELVSNHIWRYGFFEPDVCLYMIRLVQKGMTFLDIGGHFGFFSLFASRLVGQKGKVYTFEPAASTYKQLRRNIESVPDCFNIETYENAAFSETTNLEFIDYGLEYSAYNSAYGIRSDIARKNKKNISVSAIKIDDFVKERAINKIDFIKIDAESTEMHVLTGMSQTIERDKPILVVELGDFGIEGVPKSKEIIKWLTRKEYSMYEFNKGEIVRHYIRGDYPYCNILFVR